MRSLFINPIFDVKPDPSDTVCTPINVELGGQSGNRLVSITREPDGELCVTLNRHHPRVRDWLRADNASVRVLTLDRLLKAVIRSLHAIDGLSGGELRAVETITERCLRDR